MTWKELIAVTFAASALTLLFVLGSVGYALWEPL